MNNSTIKIQKISIKFFIRVFIDFVYSIQYLLDQCTLYRDSTVYSNLESRDIILLIFNFRNKNKKKRKQNWQQKRKEWKDFGDSCTRIKRC